MLKKRIFYVSINFQFSTIIRNNQTIMGNLK